METVSFEEILNTKGRLIYTNRGVSMMPLLREGRDLMVIEAIDRPLRVYDAVLFVRPGVTGRGRYVLHRIMGVNDDGSFFIIGDNCIGGETVKREHIIGILTHVIRGEKEIDCFSESHMRYVRLWWKIYPLRMVYKRAESFFWRTGSFVKRRILRIR